MNQLNLLFGGVLIVFAIIFIAFFVKFSKKIINNEMKKNRK
jgi:hypothetical protein